MASNSFQRRDLRQLTVMEVGVVICPIVESHTWELDSFDDFFVKRLTQKHKRDVCCSGVEMEWMGECATAVCARAFFPR